MMILRIFKPWGLIFKTDGSEKMSVKENSKEHMTAEIEALHQRISELQTQVDGRRQAEQALRRSERELDSIIRTTPDIIFRLDTDGKFTFISDAVKKYGYSPEKVLGKDFLYLVHPEDRAKTKQRIADRLAGKKISKKMKIRLINKDTTTRYFGSNTEDGADCYVFRIESERLYRSGEGADIFLGLQGIARDITEQIKNDETNEKLETQLIQAQKMEAIGTLAGGISHDFNNILGAILGYAQLAEMNLSEDNKARDYIKQILAAGNRAKGLVGQILAFSRQSAPKKIPVDIGVIAKEAIKLLRASLPANIDIRQKIRPNLCAVMADQTQIYQIIINLCTNALHAMEKDGGMLDLSLVSVAFNREEADAYHDLQARRYLRMTITDTGHGMDPITVSRIFDPYFTTKEINEGTGLGLATVHGIVKDHDGMIKVYSEPGSGTSFQVLLPCLEERASTEETVTRPLSSGTEKILFLDDDEALVDLGTQMLKRLGYGVEGTTIPHEALKAFKAKPDTFDLVMTDMTMPDMSGEKFAQEILKIRPDIPIIICTGFSNMMSPEKAREKGIKGFLMKPLTMSDLSKGVRNVLSPNSEGTN
jgi:PAS domain S-box-containing protein